jgi:D-proline reductase (dithiol) PrdB
MPFEYLPIMAQNSAPRPPRVLVAPSKLAWGPVKKPVSESRIALLSSAALRLANQEPFIPREDLSYRSVPSDPGTGEITIDHHSGIGRVPKQAPCVERLSPDAERGEIRSVAPFHFSFMGGVRQPQKIENDLAPAIANELRQAQVDLALLVPY